VNERDLHVVRNRGDRELETFLPGFGGFQTSLARRFCRHFDRETSNWLGFELGLKFSELGIRNLNSTVDRIFVTMPVGTARKLFELSGQEHHRRFVEAIRDRFILCADLVPFPSDAIRDWLIQPVESLSKNELCDLLYVFVAPDIDDRIYADIAGGGDARMAFEDSVDWERFEKMVAAHRLMPPKSPRERHPPGRSVKREVLVARSGTHQLRLPLAADLFPLLRSVGSADLAKVVDKHLTASTRGPKSRAALQDLSVAPAELARFV
jgi:hypothetical protein